MCHGEAGMEMDKNGKTIKISVNASVFKSSAHGKLKCVECHKGFNPDDIPHKERITPVDCKSCHKAPLEKHPFHPQLALADGMGGTPDVNCKGCHGNHQVRTKNSPTSPTNFMNSTEYCGKCHKKEKELHIKSDHYFQLNKNNPQAPTCIYCHTKAVTKNFKVSAVQLKKNQEDLCLSCHLDAAHTKTQYSTSLINYRNSVHGQAISKGISAAAVCTDCHGAHIFEKASSPTSNIRKSNVANVCSKCHIGVSQEYKQSIHGVALEKGNPDVPTCSYCHGEHSISAVVEVPLKMFTDNQINPQSAVKTKMVYCIKCHADEKMMSKYGIATFNKAHDWLPSLGKHNETVRCVDCHSSYTPPNLSHNLLPPEKTIKKCEECHSKNSVLMSKLYKHEKTQSRKKYGFINGTLLSDAYVVGTTRNLFLDSFTVIAFVVILIGIGFHAFMRWYFKKGH
ncbi:MAG: hypothetical protein A2X64_09480 [Ignavibacteria bacterium GWF2_33_9]|nr:MAG: hypothetical protein A2X64_09480 [Ignavibacteria bacterium GWF2_33_9]